MDPQIVKLWADELVIGGRAKSYPDIIEAIKTAGEILMEPSDGRIVDDTQKDLLRVTNAIRSMVQMASHLGQPE